jgi:hypothetical protein
MQTRRVQRATVGRIPISVNLFCEAFADVGVAIEWSHEDSAYIGYCLDLFPYGGVCDAPTRLECLKILQGMVEEELEALSPSRVGDI